MRAFKAGFPRRMLWEKYKFIVWGKGGISEKSFYQALYKHQKHKLPGAVIVQTVNHVGQDVQGIAKMVTELMAKKIEGMSPEDINFKDYGTVHKVAMDEKKLQLDKNAQMLAFAAIFGIPESIDPIESVQSVEGEEVHDELRSPENEGNKPQDSQ